MAYRKQLTRLKAPYLKRILIDPARVEDWEQYPWNLPPFRGHDFAGLYGGGAEGE